ncbi:MAG: energy-coupling factor transporter ATPase [Clostridia bacterium]|nr:energy-coupling factor transporter ATPase [Clostridia bacterium]
MEAILFENVTFEYEENRPVVCGMSFAVEQGSFTAILGRNGSGKSTAAKLINCLITPKSGRVTVLGMDASVEENEFAIRKKAGMVFQNPDNQTVATIVEDDVAFGPENIGVPREEIGERIDFALNAVGMQKYRHTAVSRLSGGQKQRVAIAGVLSLQPEILILDESTAMLDPKGRKEVVETAKKLNKEKGMTILLITHYMEEAVDCDRVLVADQGKIALSGTPEEVFADRDKLRALGLKLPRAAIYAEKLQKAGVPLPNTILTEQQLTEALCALAQNN